MEKGEYMHMYFLSSDKPISSSRNTDMCYQLPCVVPCIDEVYKAY